MKHWICVVVLLVASMGANGFAAEPTRVGVTNIARIFEDMQERKDVRAKMDSDLKLLENVDREKREKINALRSSRDALKSDTPQYQEKNAELLKAAIEHDSWSKINQANFQREQKLQMKTLFAKIEAAVGEIAKQKGLDLVLSDQRATIPDELDQVNVEQLKGLINSRNVLYVGEKIDISPDVLALLDARYRAGNKAQ